jgi:hypothetical protein
MRIIRLFLLTALLTGCQSEITSNQEKQKYSYRGWNILSSHRENGLKTLDKAVEYNVNHIELSHYQLCHDLKDLRKPANREAVNFFIKEAHKRSIQDVFVWDHAFYHIDYYPNEFKVKTRDDQDFAHHTAKFEGVMEQQLNLDDPAFWQWVYSDYDSLLGLVPELDGIVLTFIETGSYVIYQHSEKLKTPGQKLRALVDSLANYFIDKKNLKLTIRTFIYNQFEQNTILEALNLIHHDDIKVMIKMVPHDWFLTYPYQDYVEKIPFPVVIEYDCGMEYAGENIIANSFTDYFTRAFKFYNQFNNVIGYCARADRFEETAAVGTPGEVNMYALSQLCQDPNLSVHEIQNDFIINNYGEQSLDYLTPAFDSAISIIMSSMYTLGQHTANHSRLNFHRKNIYQSHTIGEWYDPGDQIRWVGHDVNRRFHNYKDVINTLSFPAYKIDTAGLRKDIAWVLDSAWLEPGEKMTEEYLNYIITEKEYAIRLAEKALKEVEKALPYIADSALADRLYHNYNRTLIFAKERKGAAQALYGYRLWSRGEEYQSSELATLIYSGLDEADQMLQQIDHYPVHTPLGQWRWQRDRESYDIYKLAITQTGWEEFGMGVVPQPQ